MKSLLLILLSTFLFNSAFARANQAIDSLPVLNRSLELLKSVPGQYSIMETDALGNLYLIQDAQLKKISATGDTVSVYNDVKRFGQPTCLDATNPFKTLLYYKPYSTLVILDNMLAVRGIINLRKSGIFSASAISTSYDSRIWVFDEQELKLKKLSDEGKVLMESSDLRQLTGTAPEPQQMFDNEGNVFLYDTATGFILFDYYGAYEQTLPFKNWKAVNVRDRRLSGITENHFVLYTLKSLDLKSFPLPSSVNGVLSLSRNGNKLYVRKENSIDIFKINVE